ncbi:Transcriptional repressor MprA [Rhodococcoides fascians]|nr:Transcriptional repressor MprA [Rhodococcus fascians]
MPVRYRGTVTADSIDPAQLDFMSFVEFAVEKASAELEQVDPVAMRLVLELHRVTGAVVYDLESSVHRPSGWTWSGFRVLFVLWLVGPSESKRIAELAGISRSATSALVKTLIKDGLVEAERSITDGRALTVSLTESGHSAITDTFAAHNRREQLWADALTGEERQILTGLLQKLATAIDQDGIKRR